MAIYRVKPGCYLRLPMHLLLAGGYDKLPPHSEVCLKGDLEAEILREQGHKLERTDVEDVCAGQGAIFVPVHGSGADLLKNDTEDRGLRAPSRDRAVRPKGK